MEIDTSNKFLVGSTTGPDPRVVILNLPLQARTTPELHAALPLWPAPAPLREDEALNLAAWLVAITCKRAEFLALLDAIERT